MLDWCGRLRVFSRLVRDFFHVGRVNGTIEKERILWREVAAALWKKGNIFAFKREENEERKELFLRCLPSRWLENRSDQSVFWRVRLWFSERGEERAAVLKENQSVFRSDSGLLFSKRISPCFRIEVGRTRKVSKNITTSESRTNKGAKQQLFLFLYQRLGE